MNGKAFVSELKVPFISVVNYPTPGFLSLQSLLTRDAFFNESAASYVELKTDRCTLSQFAFLSFHADGSARKLVQDSVLLNNKLSLLNI